MVGPTEDAVVVALGDVAIMVVGVAVVVIEPEGVVL